MNLIKTSFLSLIATVIKILVGLVINKAIAMFIGPSGLALIGQFRNFTQMSMTVATGAINSGVTKYVAEYGSEREKNEVLISTSLIITISCSVITGILLSLFSGQLSVSILDDISYQYVFFIFGLTVILFSLNQLILSILNGLREIKKYILINVIQSLSALFFTTILIYFFGIDGALVALVTNQSVVLVIVAFILRKHKILKGKKLIIGFDKTEAKKLIKFSAMALTSAAMVPMSHIFIRKYIVENINWEAAGYWQAMWYISTMYLMVVTTALSTYFLPKFSELSDKRLIKNEIINGYKLIIPLVIAMAGVIYLLKDFIIWFLFTKEFEPMRELFRWQLVGDFFKLASWLISFLMISKAMMKEFIITEIIFSISFVVFSILFINEFGLIGVTYAHVINYILYFITVYFVTRKIWV
ncbi:O-antigen translocase [Vibrio fortis]|uniref:O-antigen translocase n=1 Tax=Vibrio fortis TaxID=212667 RepID=UPI0036F2EA57